MGQVRTFLHTCLLLCLAHQSIAQWQLSDKAEIYYITCGPYQGELYSAFGHSAIRVSDPQNRFDIVYNYGVFDFDQPNFYLNFTRGNLLYMLAVTDYHGFKNSYIAQDRFIHEQALNLNQEQKQQLFNFLQWNAQVENRDYLYDYFYDNCATRIRDILPVVLGNDLLIDTSGFVEGKTVRELCGEYLHYQPWGKLGIDLCLGMPMDEKLSIYNYQFLPDYVERTLEASSVMVEGSKEPLVKRSISTYESRNPQSNNLKYWRPQLVLWSFFILMFILSLIEWKRGKPWRFIDVIFFGIVGLIGLLLTLLWFFTDHKAAANNLNILWAFPTHFVVALLLVGRFRSWMMPYFMVTGIVSILLLVFWMWLPQELNYALIPILMIIIIRSWMIWQYLRALKKNN